MDIFDLVEEAVTIDNNEKTKQEKIEKERKVNIFGVLSAAAEKNYNFYNSEILEKNLEKDFSPFIVNLWLSKITSAGLTNNKKDDKVLQSLYCDFINNVNTHINKNLFSFSKPLIFLKSCGISTEPLSTSLGNYGRNGFKIDFVKAEKKSSKIKTTPELMNYLVQELYTNKDKIIDMINNGVITATQIKEIQKDLDTLTVKPKKVGRK